MLKKLFSRYRTDVVEFKESKYCVQLNDQYHWFDTKQAMLDFISNYSEKNVVYSLCMFRIDTFNLMK